MLVKDSYYYIFYKFYRFLQLSPLTKGNTKFKAVLFLIIVESWMAFSLINYYDILFSKKRGTISSSLTISLIAAIWIIKWFFFIRNDNWRNYVEKFDKWPKAKNRRGTLIVILIVLLLLINFIVSFYLNPLSND
ncbi:hypothetical protein SAMN04488128_103708 [Chitinophaga eiseniae]|uniref:Uncharacterized protein n=1 Tax=Chitinophaga eiseniae TaxID=634771 RepID=A0A1T4SX42_9BACT|nr:hypothetical protein SAMN04488128_103708 [Chitinophaga eiseniae]